MDLRSGKMYDSLEDARKAGVSEADLVEVDRHLKTAADMRAAIPTLKFPKGKPFGTIKSLVEQELAENK